MEPDARLNELDKDEWRSVLKSVQPELSDEEFDQMWDEFVKFKREKQLQ